MTSPGRLLGAGEDGAEHDAVGAGGERLGDVAGIADAAVGDQRDVGALAGHRATSLMAVICGNADAGDDARGADGARADADLDGVGACFDQRPGGGRGGDVAGDDLELRMLSLDLAHPFDARRASGRGRYRRR